MRYLVLGSQGMLGGEFVRQLTQGTWNKNQGTVEVVAWSRADLDITNEQEVMQKVAALKPQIILNCAAYNNVDKAEDEPEVANAINGEAVGYIAAAAAQCAATLVHFSTDYVFDGENKEGYKESDDPRPISKYGESKALGERKVLEVFDSHPPLIPPSGRGENGSDSPPFEGGVRGGWYIIRTSKLFGPAGTGATSKKSFPEIIIRIAKEKGKVEAVDAEAGSPTYVKDLTEITLELLGLSPEREGLSPAPSGIYHVVNSGSCTWYKYAKAAVEFSGVKAEVMPVGPDYFPRKAKRPERVVLLNTKLPPLRPWQDALKEFLG